MGQFNINITALGGHGCDRKAAPGEKLYSRCRRFDCPDCRAYDFLQTLQQMGVVVGEATYTHLPGTNVEVVDDLLKNKRIRGQF